ncbi:MAG: hypothetical protein IJ710_06475 [Prevotella sp.]|nr:hypothetical protein [Prevotella sp.]
MLQRDYITRLIREFFEALELLLNRKDAERQREEMRRMYTQYVGSYEFYHTAAIADVMQSFSQFREEERMSRMEMLAELYYAEAGLLTGPAREMLQQKAFALFDFLDRHSGTFSFDRQRKMMQLKQQLSATVATE